MGDTDLVVAIVAAIFAFLAGRKVQHVTRTWSDHKTAAATAKRLRGARWVALVSAAVFVGIMLGYFFALGRV